jgi:hypothetical protein
MRIGDAVLNASFGVARFALSLDAADRRHVPHARRLVIETEGDGVLEILLEQGFGHWTAPRTARFDFTATTVKQAAEMLRVSAGITGDAGRSTYIFADISDRATRRPS